MFKKIIIKIDDFREEVLEEFIADEILGRLDDSKTVDELERRAIMAGIAAANAYLGTYGVPEVPDEIKKRIADAGVKSINKANKLIQKQLKKKSKAYLKRRGGEDV